MTMQVSLKKQSCTQLYLRLLVKLSDVAELEQLSEPEFADHADSADIFSVFSGVSGPILVGFKFD